MINNDLYSKGLATAVTIGLSSGLNITSELLSRFSNSNFCFRHISKVDLNTKISITFKEANHFHHMFRYASDAFKWIALTYKIQLFGHLFFGASLIVFKPMFYSALAIPLATKEIVWLSERTGILKKTAVSVDQNHSKFAHIASIVTSLALVPYSIYAFKNFASMLGLLLVPLTALYIDTASLNTKILLKGS